MNDKRTIENYKKDLYCVCYVVWTALSILIDINVSTHKSKKKKSLLFIASSLISVEVPQLVVVAAAVSLLMSK